MNSRPAKKSAYRSQLRAEQAAATRELVLDAATRLFVERGYAATSIAAIAEAAGVGRSTVFAAALFGAAESFPGAGALVPTRNSDLMRWCLGEKLRITQTLTLMSSGLYNEPNGAWLPSILY